MANQWMTRATTGAAWRLALLTGIVLALLAPLTGRAAKAPLTEEELRKEATHIVSGTVVAVSSKTQKSEVVKGFGIHRDRVFTIRIKVSKASKGDGIKEGEEIEVKAWQPSRRIPALPGLQGHTPIPEAGDAVTLYLIAKEGRPIEPILPNGIVIDKEAEEPGKEE